MHRDIKPENILIKGGVAKIGDFGFAMLGDSAVGVFGTPGYIAPEVLMKQKYDKACNMWSIGAVTHKLLTWEFLVGREDMNNMDKCVYPEKHWDNVDNRFKSNTQIISKILFFTPESRLFASDMLAMIQKV